MPAIQEESSVATTSPASAPALIGAGSAPVITAIGRLELRRPEAAWHGSDADHEAGGLGFLRAAAPPLRSSVAGEHRITRGGPCDHLVGRLEMTPSPPTTISAISFERDRIVPMLSPSTHDS